MRLFKRTDENNAKDERHSRDRNKIRTDAKPIKEGKRKVAEGRTGQNGVEECHGGG